MINSFVAIDLETTGISPSEDRIIEIGAIKVVDGKECGSISTFVNPRMRISERITQITGIDNMMVSNAPVIEDVLDDILDFIEELPLLGHNIMFDYSFLKSAAVSVGKNFEKDGIDTLKLARKILPDAESKRLEYLCSYLHIDPGNSHRAYDDARSAKILYEKLYQLKPDEEGFEKTIRLEYGIKKKSPITPAQLKYLKALMAAHNIVPETEPESMTKNDASRMIDKILSSYGRIY